MAAGSSTIFYDLLQQGDVRQIQIVKPKSGERFYVVYLNGVYTTPLYLDPTTMKVYNQEAVR